MSEPTSPELDKTIASDGDADSTEDRSRPGTVLLAGRYQVLSLLGVGGMGAVYRVRDTQLDELVALKVLRNETAATPAALRRFRDEVKLARKVTHRNVARTFDIGDQAGTMFLTMELLEGESLAGRIGRGPLPIDVTLGLALDIARGLEAAHAAEVVHRDLKPENVFLTVDGRAVVTDFGIALASAAAATDELVGTPAYAAPEQVDGTGQVDARADLYALGEVIYEMLTGQRTWPAPTAARAMMMRLVSPPPDLHALRAEVPAPLAELVARLLARRREDRYPTATAVIAALQGIRVNASGVSAPSEPALPPAIVRSERSVAVLPLRCHGTAEYVAEGLLEDIVDTLAMTRGLRVRPVGVVARFAQARLPLDEIGRELGVQVVVDGSLRATADGLRLTARAISVDDNFQIWAQRWERRESESLALADDAAAAIATALTRDLAVPERGAHDPGAADVYLRARAAFRRAYYSFSRLPAVVELFDAAVTLAPADPHVLAGAALAHARVAAWGAGGDASRRARERAQVLADRAIELAPQLGEAWMAIATLRRNACEFVAAVGALRSALRVKPHSAEAREMLGSIALEAGDLDAGIELLSSALQLEPSNPRPRLDLARGYTMRGDPQRAREVLDGELNSDEPLGARCWVRARLAIWSADEQVRRVVDLESQSTDPKEARPLYVVQRFAATRVMSDDDLAFLEMRCRENGQRLRLINRQVLAEVSAVMGASDEVLVEHVRAAIDDGLRDLAWLDHCPLFTKVRVAPAWLELRQRLVEEAERIRAALRG